MIELPLRPRVRPVEHRASVSDALAAENRQLRDELGRVRADRDAWWRCALKTGELLRAADEALALAKGDRWRCLAAIDGVASCQRTATFFTPGRWGGTCCHEHLALVTAPGYNGTPHGYEVLPIPADTKRMSDLWRHNTSDASIAALERNLAATNPDVESPARGTDPEWGVHVPGLIERYGIFV